jgi:predicted RNase H-like HicB family nuclease
MDRYFVNIEPVEPTGVVLMIEGLPRLLIFGRTREEALRRAREALAFHLSAGAGAHAMESPLVELVPRAAA